jgi:hypothetical protein
MTTTEIMLPVFIIVTIKKPPKELNPLGEVTKSTYAVLSWVGIILP